MRGSTTMTDESDFNVNAVPRGVWSSCAVRSKGGPYGSPLVRSLAVRGLRGAADRHLRLGKRHHEARLREHHAAVVPRCPLRPCRARVRPVPGPAHRASAAFGARARLVAGRAVHGAVVHHLQRGARSDHRHERGLPRGAARGVRSAAVVDREPLPLPVRVPSVPRGGRGGAVPAVREWRRAVVWLGGGACAAVVDDVGGRARVRRARS